MLPIYTFITVLTVYRPLLVYVVAINSFLKEYCWYIVEFCDLWTNGSGIWKRRLEDTYGKISKHKHRPV